MRTENAEYLGEFWLPETPEAKVHGTLTIEDGGRVRLKTVGLLAEQLDLMNGKVTQHSRIIGQLHNGQLVTLEDSFYWRRPSFGVPPTTFLQARYALVGLALGGEADGVFNSITFTTDCLNQWHQKTGVSFELDEGEDQRKATIRYEAIDDVELWSEGGKRLDLTFEWNLSDVGPGAVASVTQYSYLRYSSDERIPLEELTGVVHRVQHFLSFAVGATVSISEVSVRSRDDALTGNGRTLPRPVWLYYRSYPFTAKCPEIDGYTVPLPFAVITTKTQTVFRQWFSIYERAGKALGLYWGAINDSAKYVDGRFLFIAQALEAFHRLSSIAANDTERQKMCLARRLADLASPFGGMFDDPLFLRKVVGTRNYFTHWDPKSKAKAATVEELWPICAKLEALFSLLLMREIGLTDDMIARLVDNNHALKRSLSHRCDVNSTHAS